MLTFIHLGNSNVYSFETVSVILFHVFITQQIVVYPVDKMARKMVQINAMKIDYIKLKLTAAYHPDSQSFNRC